MDKNSRIIVWNKAAEKISIYSRDEVSGTRGIWKLLCPDSTFRESIIPRAAAIINEGDAVKITLTSRRLNRLY